MRTFETHSDEQLRASAEAVIKHALATAKDPKNTIGWRVCPSFEQVSVLRSGKNGQPSTVQAGWCIGARNKFGMFLVFKEDTNGNEFKLMNAETLKKIPENDNITLPLYPAESSPKPQPAVQQKIEASREAMEKKLKQTAGEAMKQPSVPSPIAKKKEKLAAPEKKKIPGVARAFMERKKKIQASVAQLKEAIFNNQTRVEKWMHKLAGNDPKNAFVPFGLVTTISGMKFELSNDLSRVIAWDGKSDLWAHVLFNGKNDMEVWLRLKDAPRDSNGIVDVLRCTEKESGEWMLDRGERSYEQYLQLLDHIDTGIQELIEEEKLSYAQAALAFGASFFTKKKAHTNEKTQSWDDLMELTEKEKAGNGA